MVHVLSNNALLEKIDLWHGFVIVVHTDVVRCVDRRR